MRLLTRMLPVSCQFGRKFVSSLVNISKNSSGNVLKIGINRAHKRNCINHQTAVELLNAFEQFEKDDSVKVGVLYGEGGCFCSGWDLSTIGQNNKELLDLDLKKYRPIGPTMMRYKKPVIAAVEGFAVAGGLELALTCDLIVAAQNSIFGVFCRRFGVPLVDGGTVRLPKLIGLSKAMDMILTGRPIKAELGYQWGLVNRLVAPNTSLDEAVTLAEEISKFPQLCLNADRRSAYYCAFDAKSYEDAFEFELENGLPILEQESVKGAQTFVQGTGRHGKFD